MTPDLAALVDHTGDEDCAVCKAQDIVAAILVPAVASWEVSQGLPRFSLTIQGAAGLLGAMLEDGMGRGDLEEALRQALDDVEQRIAEDLSFGGPPQGSA